MPLRCLDGRLRYPAQCCLPHRMCQLVRANGWLVFGMGGRLCLWDLSSIIGYNIVQVRISHIRCFGVTMAIDHCRATRLLELCVLFMWSITPLLPVGLVTTVVVRGNTYHRISLVLGNKGIQLRDGGGEVMALSRNDFESRTPLPARTGVLEGDEAERCVYLCNRVVVCRGLRSCIVLGVVGARGAQE